MPTARKQFTFYESFYRTVSRIKDKATRADAYEAIIQYALLGEEPDLDQLPDTVAIVFEAVRPNLDAARKKSEAGKLGGSKPKQTEANGDTVEAPESKNKQMEATSKQTQAPSKQAEANRKLEKELDIELDIEQMLESHLPPLGAAPEAKKTKNSQQVDMSGLSQPLQAKLDTWLAYKRERRENYKPTGLQALVTRLQSAAAQFGDAAVCELIDNSMSSGYAGILFDRLGQQKRAAPRNGPQAWTPGTMEIEAARRMMQHGGGA